MIGIEVGTALQCVCSSASELWCEHSEVSTRMLITLQVGLIIANDTRYGGG